jgi:uncharacterized hydrophobic protein (TIGR00341 family)
VRLLEVAVPADRLEEAREAVEDGDVMDVWTVWQGPDRGVLRILVAAEKVEAVTDTLTDRFGAGGELRIVALAVEATVPRPEEEDDDGEEEEGDADPDRVSRDELVTALSRASRPRPVYFVTVALSTVVAALGLVRDDVAVIIGAMVIAPLLGPNVALSLASALGDGALARKAARSAVGGAAVALAVAVVLGMLLAVDPQGPEVLRRTRVSASDVGLALAAGSAGALAYTTGLPAAVIGVMVAVALLPPLTVLGLLLGAGLPGPATGALVLTVTNVTCINLAGVATFLAQRVTPRTGWEERQARKATLLSVGSWLAMLAVLLWVILTRFR